MGKMGLTTTWDGKSHDRHLCYVNVTSHFVQKTLSLSLLYCGRKIAQRIKNPRSSCAQVKCHP